MKINVNGTWKDGTTWIKENGEWKQGIVWVNVNGTWKKESTGTSAADYTTNGLQLYLNGYGKSNPDMSWIDLSRNSHNATLFNFAGNAASGWNNNGLQFDGINDYVNIVNYIPITSDISHTCEFYLETPTPTATMRLVGFGDGDGRYYIEFSSSGIALGIGSSKIQIASSIYLPGANTKTHYVFVRNGSNYALWRDGMKLRTGTTNIKGAINKGIGYNIGTTYAADNEFFRGKIYLNRFYNRALSDDEIVQNYKNAISNSGGESEEPPPNTNGIYYVATTGSDINIGTIDAPWKTIQKACNTLKAGETVYIRGGIYNEKVTVNVSGNGNGYITIGNYPGENAIINGTGLSPESIISIVNKSYIKIKGLEICNNNASGTPIGIYIGGSGMGIQILNNKVHDIIAKENGHGIAAYGENGTTSIYGLIIDGNEVYDCILGSSESVVVNGNVDNFQITNNKIHDNNNIGIDCIGFEGTASSNDQARNGLVRANTIYNISSKDNPQYGGSESADGIYVDGGKSIIIEKNLVYNCDIGIEVASEHLGKITDNVIVRNNIVYGSHLYGVCIGGASSSNGYAENNTFVNNTLYNNSTGIAIQQSRNNKIENNIIYDNSGLIGGSVGSNSFNYNIWYGVGSNVPSGMSSTNKFADPKFADVGSNDFHLSSNSPAVNAGNPNAGSEVGVSDYGGNTRIKNIIIDCGAYESNYTTPDNPPPDTGGATSIKKYLCYYGYPTSINGANGSISAAVNVFKQYDIITFADDLTSTNHSDHNNTITIMSQLQSIKHGIELTGYVPIGQLNDSTKLTMAQIKAKIDIWQSMGVTGIFLDEFGYDYLCTRSHQNEIVSYCHNKGFNVIVNSWQADYVFSSASTVDGYNGNPGNLEPVINSKDYSLFENMFFEYNVGSSTQYASTTSRAYDAYNYYKNYKSKYGTKTLALDSMVNNSHYYALGYIGCKALNIDGYGADYLHWANDTVIIYDTPITVLDSIVPSAITVASYNGVSNAKYTRDKIEFIWQGINADSKGSPSSGTHKAFYNGVEINTLSDLVLVR